MNASTKMTVSLCGSSGGLGRRPGTARVGVGRVGVVRDDGRVGVVGDGVRVGARGGVRGGVARTGVRVTGRGCGASSSMAAPGRAGVRAARTGVGTTFAGAASSCSAEYAPKHTAKNTTDAAITIVFADFMTSPFKSLCVDMSFLHTIIGKKPPKGYKKNPFFVKFFFVLVFSLRYGASHRCGPEP